MPRLVTMSRLAVVAACVAMLAAGPAAADDDFWAFGFPGLARQYNAQQLRATRPAAAAGDPQAQYKLGEMYREGRGVPQDYAEAARWFRRAAEQGQPYAQYRLGAFYAVGRGVPESRMQAHVWLNLAAGQGILRAASFRDDLEGSMSKAQIAAAQREARLWMPRREHRY